MTFAINFLKTPVPEDRRPFGEKAVFGKITIGDFWERIILDTDYWSTNDYRWQWIDAIERLLAKSENAKTALITGMYDPSGQRFPLEVWILYREGARVYIQNEHIPFDQIPQPFNTMSVYSSINDRQTHTEEGDRISEWTTSSDELRDFLQTLQKQHQD